MGCGAGHPDCHWAAENFEVRRGERFGIAGPMSNLNSAPEAVTHAGSNPGAESDQFSCIVVAHAWRERSLPAPLTGVTLRVPTRRQMDGIAAHDRTMA
jgi:hypothetical protein